MLKQLFEGDDLREHRQSLFEMFEAWIKSENCTETDHPGRDAVCYTVRVFNSILDRAEDQPMKPTRTEG